MYNITYNVRITLINGFNEIIIIKYSDIYCSEYKFRRTTYFTKSANIETIL